MGFTTTEQEIVSTGVKAIIYAPSGYGKTLLCATAPRPLIISAEKGLLSLSRRNIEKVFGVNAWGVNYDPMNVWTIENIDDLTQALNWCNNQANWQYFDTVIIDSLTEVGEKVLANAKGQVKDVRQAYGELIDKMIMTVKGFRDIPGKHVIFLTKAEMVKDEITGMTTLNVMMPGAKLAQQLPYLTDEVFYLGINKDNTGATYRYLQTSADLQRYAKDRSGMLDAVEPAHLAHIITKILGVSQ